MTDIVLCCGKVCSGKSTFARQLERELGFIHFSADDWMLHFYEETTDRQLFDRRQAACMAMILEISGKLLAHGQPVVLDFGFWKRADRADTRGRFTAAGHRVSLVHFPVAPATQVAFMNRRQSENAGRHYVFDQATLDALNAFWEEPAPEEGLISAAEFMAGRRD